MPEKTPSKVSNPYRLTPDEILKITGFEYPSLDGFKRPDPGIWSWNPKIFGAGDPKLYPY